MAGLNDMNALHQCGHCGLMHAGPCPRVKAIEYYENGTVKRVEYHTPQNTLTISPPASNSDTWFRSGQ